MFYVAFLSVTLINFTVARTEAVSSIISPIMVGLRPCPAQRGVAQTEGDKGVVSIGHQLESVAYREGRATVAVVVRQFAVGIAGRTVRLATLGDI